MRLRMSELTDDDSVSEVTGYHSQLISHWPSQPHHDKLQTEVVKIAFSFFFPSLSLRFGTSLLGPQEIYEQNLASSLNKGMNTKTQRFQQFALLHSGRGPVSYELSVVRLVGIDGVLKYSVTGSESVREIGRRRRRRLGQLTVSSLVFPPDRVNP